LYYAFLFSEAFRLQFPDVPPELADIVPSPEPVLDSHPVVKEIVDGKLKKDIDHVDGLPPEIYVEVLRRACREAEGKFLIQNPTSHTYDINHCVVQINTSILHWAKIIKNTFD